MPSCLLIAVPVSPCDVEMLGANMEQVTLLVHNKYHLSYILQGGEKKQKQRNIKEEKKNME
jgi:hypothetical protein